ncbi:hypothetical protein E2C01_027550 [Portunus trituberculatus]|uniref:Uncharacterized protein n=1 Tax=Portunus trituberculatus TaxID=210409 RepID=A0A5B7ELX7_PORTR|nr:hypothetical protein [Portunus trituberculatus]
MPWRCWVRGREEDRVVGQDEEVAAGTRKVKWGVSCPREPLNGVEVYYCRHVQWRLPRHVAEQEKEYQERVWRAPCCWS